MQLQDKFQSEIKVVSIGGRNITVEHLTPILSPKERERRKAEVEKRLYDVFVKYADIRN